MEENRGTPENKKTLAMIPFSVHEAAMDRAERHARNSKRHVPCHQVGNRCIRGCKTHRHD